MDLCNTSQRTTVTEQISNLFFPLQVIGHVHSSLGDSQAIRTGGGIRVNFNKDWKKTHPTLALFQES